MSKASQDRKRDLMAAMKFYNAKLDECRDTEKKINDLIDMDRVGAKIDQEYLAELKQLLKKQYAELKALNQ